MNFLEKLDFLMEKNRLNKRTLSQKSEIPYTTIDAWYKKGYEGLKLTTLRKLNDFFNTTLDYWVLDEVTDPNYGKTSGFNVKYEEMEHLEKYRLLDDFGKETIDIMLNRETKRIKQLSENKKHLEKFKLEIADESHVSTPEKFTDVEEAKAYLRSKQSLAALGFKASSMPDSDYLQMANEIYRNNE